MTLAGPVVYKRGTHRDGPAFSKEGWSSRGGVDVEKDMRVRTVRIPGSDERTTQESLKALAVTYINRARRLDKHRWQCHTSRLNNTFRSCACR